MARFATVFVPLLLVALTGAGFLRCTEASGVSFNYLQAGADWLDNYQFPDSQCSGNSQSPINIIKNDVVKLDDPIVAKINTAGVVDDAERENVGQTFELTFSNFLLESDLKLPLSPEGAIVGVTPEPESLASVEDSSEGDATFVSAVPEQFHFHIPSENTIDGLLFPMEAHLVTRVSQDQVSYCPSGGCFVVFSTLFKLDSSPNTFLARIFNGIETDTFEDGEAITGPVSLDGLLPDDKEKYFYWNGSLTTPNCNENVAWILFQDFQTVSQDQVAQLQKNFGLRRTTCQNNGGNDVNAVLECNNVGDLKNNRPVQPLYDRKVFSSEGDDASNTLGPSEDSIIRRAFLSR